MACDLPVATVLRVDRFELRRGEGFAAQLPELQLEAGQVAGLYGPSGAGKTSLLEGMFGLAPPRGQSVDGSVALLGQEFGELAPGERLHQLRTNMSWVMQDAQAALDPLQSVLGQLQQATGADAEACTKVLTELGVADAEALVQRLPHEISGGQAQRVLLAVALLRKPRLLVADEPSASLDDASRAVLVTKLRQLQEHGTAILLATHDRRLLEELDADILMANGGVFAPGQPVNSEWPDLIDDSGLGEVPVIRVKKLKVRFGDNDVLDGVDLVWRRGEVVALVGDSGVGKTPLAHVLWGHRRPDAGVIERPPRSVAVQLLSQDAY
ncbi:MAG: ATP-binding cassette domain-containing protein, partial [Planctomycetota bacterium]|nr:ATP-binding cassette domain-containing protein [Planctomycetota bacterium]